MDYSSIVNRAEAFRAQARAALDSNNTDTLQGLRREAADLRALLIQTDDSSGEEWSGAYGEDSYWTAPRYATVNAIQSGRGDLDRLEGLLS